MSAPASPKASLDSDDSEAGKFRSISYAGDRRADRRRKSIQFNIGGGESQPPRRSVSLHGHKRRSNPEIFLDSKPLDEEHKSEPKPVGRGHSPPPPKTYERGVSFDTFDNPDAADFSLTLNYKHKGYQSTRRSRTFLCGTDQNDYSDFALEWLIDELVDDGDEIVCLRAVEKDSSLASDAGIETGKYRKEAEKLFEQVIQKNSQDEKAISLVLELAVGKIQSIIQRMIRIYEPAVLVVGTRGRNLSGMQSLLPGSVSKYCLQQSPIPVIVVRPSTKREKKKKKRLADPARRSYNHILEMSERRGSRIFDASSSTDSGISKLPDEEAAVAEALGLPQSYANSRSSLSISERSSVSHDEHEPAQSNWGSLDAVMKGIPNESPATTENESVSDDEQTDRPEKDSAAVSVDNSNASTPQVGAISPKDVETPDLEPVSDVSKPPSAVPVIVTEDTPKDESETKG
ncbi:hypothetical protein MW887_006343 [Aspergillus wentii]|nr:hypothetical protein MW887_006343 [Aspergillus wentii]